MNTALFEEFVTRLQTVRETQGEEAYQAATRQFVLEGLRMGGKIGVFVTSFAKRMDFLDLDALQREASALPQYPPLGQQGQENQAPAEVPTEKSNQAQPTEPSELFVEAIKSQLPGLRTKAQMNAFMASFEAYRAVMNAILESNTAAELTARQALQTSFEVVGKATQVSNQLRDVPEAATSKASDDFRSGPSGWTEYDKQRKLLSEIEAIRTPKDLNDWYTTNRKRIDEIQTQTLRNPLLDLIRERKIRLTQEEQRAENE